MKNKVVEVNFDGLIGPTHNYSGLSRGNLASEKNAWKVSHPKAAALQGLTKMRLIHSMGIPQAILPPHQRPAIPLLRELGFTGNDQQVIDTAFEIDPDLALSCYSASAMWAANAATVAPSTDTSDGKLHLSPANLIGKFHRSIEADFTFELLQNIFKDPSQFQIHPPLHKQRAFSDEGAANHTRLCQTHDAKGVHLFVYGRSVLHRQKTPSRFPARQSLEASQAIVRRHGISSEQVIFTQQAPEAIDAGVFHNDVIAVGNESFLFCHETSFIDTHATIDLIQSKLPDTHLQTLVVKESEVPLDLAVQTYLFNSQIVTLPNGNHALIAPDDCRRHKKIVQYIDHMIRDDQIPIESAEFVPVHESMKNGGGPACLRLRVPMTEQQMNSIHQGILFSEDLDERLKVWIETHYRDELHLNDLKNPSFVTEVYEALDELTQILNLGSLYPFQKEKG